MTITLSDNDVEFLAAHVRRLCKAFDYPVPDRSDEFVVEVAGSLIGGLLSRFESQNPVAYIDKETGRPHWCPEALPLNLPPGTLLFTRGAIADSREDRVPTPRDDAHPDPREKNGDHSPGG